jgi:hypothetical protein
MAAVRRWRRKPLPDRTYWSGRLVAPAGGSDAGGAGAAPRECDAEQPESERPLLPEPGERGTAVDGGVREAAHLAGWSAGGPAGEPGADVHDARGTGLSVVEWETGRTIRIQVPAGAKLSGAQWSPDGSKLAYFANFEDATHIYVAELPSGRSRQVTRTPVLATLNTSFDWTPDGREHRHGAGAGEPGPSAGGAGRAGGSAGPADGRG